MRRNLIAQHIAGQFVENQTININLYSDLTKSNDNLEKGIISDNFNYAPDFFFEKKGSEVKLLIPKTIEALTNKLNLIETSLPKMEEEIGIEPNEISTPVYEDKTITYKRFGYKQNDECTDKDVKQKMYQYNENVYLCGNIKSDIKTCQVLLENIEDNKKYKFTLKQLTALKS